MSKYNYSDRGFGPFIVPSSRLNFSCELILMSCFVPNVNTDAETNMELNYMYKMCLQIYHICSALKSKKNANAKR